MSDIKLNRLESFNFEIDKQKLAEGVFCWSGNYVLRLQVDGEKKQIFCVLYYAGKDYRIARKNKNKENQQKENEKVDVGEVDLIA